MPEPTHSHSPATPLRVLHLLEELKPSGAEIGLRDSYALWREAGVEPHLLSNGHQLGPLADSMRAAGWPIQHLPYREHPEYLRQLRNIVVTGGFDVVHVHPEKANLWHGLTLRTVPGLRVVRSIHNVFSFTGALRTRRTLQRAVLRAAGVRMVAVSGSVHRNEADRFRNPTIRVDNGIDTGRFRPVTPDERARARHELGIADGEIAVVSIGNCNAAKNHPVILDAMADVPDVRYLHAGIEDEARTERARAAVLGLDERVDFLGTVDDVPSLLAAADAYLMPSTHEGLSIAALEAVASGTLCVFADVQGLRDLRDDVPAGIEWIPPTANGVRTALETVLAGGPPDHDPAVMHQAIEQRYSLAAWVDALVAVYRSG